MAELMTRTAVPPPTPPKLPVDSTRAHIRGSSLLLVGRIVSLGLNFAVQVLTVRYLTKSDYGAFAYALAFVAAGASVGLFGLDKAIARFTPIYHEQGHYHKLFGTLILALTTITGLGAAMILLVYALQGVLARTLINDPLSLSLLLIVIALAPLQAFDHAFQGILAVFARPKAIFFRRHLLGPALKLAAVLLVMAVRGSVYLLAVGYLVGGVIGVLVYVLMVYQILRDQTLWSYFEWRRISLPVREIFTFSVPLLSTDVVLILKGSMVVLLLEFFHGTTGVADFRAVLPVAGLNLVVLHSFKFLFTPLAARLFARDDQQGINNLYWQTAVWIAVFSFPVFALTFSLAEPLTVLLFGQRYAQSGVILALLSLGSYFNAALGFNAYTLRVYGKVAYIVAIDFLSAVIVLALCLWLIPLYGAFGAAVAASAGLVIYNVLNHAGLLLGTGIDLFQGRYLKVYASIGFTAVTLLLIQRLAQPSIITGVILAAVASLFLIRFNRRVLDVTTMFPEVGRIPLLRPLLGL
jgi:O-antigen/teichoic acid export membrane protein